MLTFYGHFSGWQSYPTVCRAIAHYLDQTRWDLRLCDLRPDGFYDRVPDIPRMPTTVRQDILARAHSGAPYQGPVLPGTGLVFGFPEWLAVVPKHERMVGYHVCDLDKIPDHWVACMNDLADLVLTPSAWCSEVFRKCGVQTPIVVVRHGVHEAFGAAPDRELDDPFVVLHCCSSKETARKGTVELLRAWLEAVRLGELDPTRHTLRLLSAFPDDHGALAHGVPGVDIVEAIPRPPELQACRYTGVHLVAQPSRAEGFGCIPLEALACGTPVLATSCTGHAERDEGPGVVVVEHGGLGPCGQSQGRAPSIEVAHLRERLLYGINHYDTLRAEALARRPTIMEHWAWPRVLSPLGDLLQG